MARRKILRRHLRALNPFRAITGKNILARVPCMNHKISPFRQAQGIGLNPLPGVVVVQIDA